jgi:hypothetical protein
MANSALTALAAGSLKPAGVGPLEGASTNLTDQTDSELEYKNALAKIKSALDARQNRAYDPTLLAISQGLLAPSATGSFGEGLGQAAGNVLKVQQQQEKENLDNSQIRLQLAQAERQQDLKNKALGIAFGTGKPTTTGAPTQAGAQAGAPAGDQSKTISVNGQQYPAGFIDMTPEKAFLIGRYDPELGKSAMEFLKLKNEGFKVQPGGYVDVTTKGGPKYTPFGGKPMVERTVPGVGVIKMPEEDAMALDEARRKGDGKTYWGIVDSTSKPISRDAVPAGGAPVVGGGDRTTESSLQAQAAADKERAVKMATAEAERTNAALDAGKSARGSQASFTRANEILADPRIKDYLGVLSRGDVTSALGNLVNEAFRIGNFSIGIPSVKKILTESGAPQEMIDKLAELGQIEAMFQMESRKGLGAGTSVSNMEQMMANRVTPSQDDPFGAYMQKLKFLQEKAKFDIELSKELKRSKLSYDQFEDTPRFDTIFNAYQNRLMNIVSPSSKGTTTKTTTTKPAGKISAEDLKKELGN